MLSATILKSIFEFGIWIPNTVLGRNTYLPKYYLQTFARLPISKLYKAGINVTIIHIWMQLQLVCEEKVHLIWVSSLSRERANKDLIWRKNYTLTIGRQQ